MSVPRSRKKDIETKARHSSFKTKKRNDHENHLLALQLQQLHNKTVSKLDDHWKSTMEVVTIFKGCSMTSGASPLGIRPSKSDMQGCLQDMHARTTPWEHFGKFTIDSWYSGEDGETSRPHTAHTSSHGAITQGTRPKTAPVVQETEDMSNEENVGGSAERPMAALSAQARNRKMLQLQAKAATMTKSKFLDLESTGPIYNRNLASAFRGDKVESAEEARKVEITVPKEDDIVTTLYDYHQPQPPPTSKKSWDLHRLRNEFQKYRDATPSQDRRAHHMKITPVFRSKGEVGTISDIKSKLSQKTKTPITDYESLVSPSRGNVKRTDDIYESTTKPQSRLRSRTSDNNDMSSDKEAEENAKYIDMMTRINRQPVLNRKVFKSPKFYVRPQERYKMDQHFLMKRYFFLQRQMNKKHEDEAVILAKAGTALVCNTTFTRSARIKFLTALIEENAEQQQQQRRFGRDEIMRRKVDAFLRNVADFVNYSAPEESLAIMVPRPRAERPISKKLLR